MIQCGEGGREGGREGGKEGGREVGTGIATPYVFADAKGDSMEGGRERGRDGLENYKCLPVQYKE